MRDFHWLSTASVKSELDENRASVKPALQDQSVDGDVTVCGFTIATDRRHIIKSNDRDRKWITAFKQEASGDTLSFSAAESARVFPAVQAFLCFFVCLFVFRLFVCFCLVLGVCGGVLLLCRPRA